MGNIKLFQVCSNGEFAPPWRSDVAAEAARRTAAGVDPTARRLGMDRRRFLASSLSTAAALVALDACSRERSRSTGTEPGGTFTVPTTATTDPDATSTTLGPQTADERVIDVQTHFLDPDEGGFGAGFPQAACGADATLCFTIDRWLDLVLGSSDTSVAVLSALPIVADPHPMSLAKMEQAKRLAEALADHPQVLLQGEAFPQVGRLEESLERMTEAVAQHRLAAWKTYTHVGGGYSMTDERGQAMLGHVEALSRRGGPAIVAVHKGFGADPADLGPAARDHPALSFLAYHSGYEGNVAEGPFASNGKGIDRFVVSLRKAGIGRGGNVYAELGSTWRSLMTKPDEAAHALGKLLVALGPERILWGTDSIWYGSPQDQIEAFRAFQITPAFQERYGYPAITDDDKRLILGGNAARLHGLTPAATPPAPSAGAQADVRLRWRDRVLGPRSARAARDTFAADHPWF